ncbi:MAG: Flp family type IVb pilin [Hyphomonadaceae bacterium]
MIRNFLQSRDGHTAIEYSMIAGLIALGIIAAITSMGGSITGMIEGLLIPALTGQEQN